MVLVSKNAKASRRLWVASAWLFVVGAAAGVCFRWAMMGSVAPGEPANIRHAHSHLMLMGWATPALMALMGARWPSQGGRKAVNGIAVAGWSAWGLALISFPLFWLYGYESVSIGGADLPLAAMASGLAILSWYGFSAVYFWAMRGVSRTACARLWDLAVVALVISSIGAWAVAGLMIAGLDTALWEAVTVHFFVDLFGGGWLVLGTLGLIRSYGEASDGLQERVGRIGVGCGVGFVFLVGLPHSITPELWTWSGSVAAGLVALGLGLIGYRSGKQIGRWGRTVMAFFSLKVVMLAAVAIPPIARWGIQSGMRVFYLHIALVGFVTLGLVVVAWREWGRAAVGLRTGWYVGVGALLLTMLPLTEIWPAQLRGEWILGAVLFGAVVATISSFVACLWAQVLRRR